jgi:hypothetical protein
MLHQMTKLLTFSMGAVLFAAGCDSTLESSDFQEASFSSDRQRGTPVWGGFGVKDQIEDRMDDIEDQVDEILYSTVFVHGFAEEKETGQPFSTSEYSASARCELEVSEESGYESDNETYTITSDWVELDEDGLYEIELDVFTGHYWHILDCEVVAPYYDDFVGRPVGTNGGELIEDDIEFDLTHSMFD